MFRMTSMFDDPFFEGHREHMRQMDSMFRDPFQAMGMGGAGVQLALPAGGHGQDRHNHRRQQQQQQNLAMVPRGGGMMDPFAHFDSMFSNMRNMMNEMASMSQSGMQMQSGGGPGNQVFQQSSFVSFSNNGQGGQPRVYQASSSSRSGPGGVRETRKSVRDSHRGVEKMSVGHHINDRSHVIERSRNAGTSQIDENQEYINLEEDEAAAFDREYQQRWQGSGGGMRGVEQRRRHRHAPVGGRPRPAISSPRLALPPSRQQRE